MWSTTADAVGSKQAAFGQGTAPVRLTNVNCAGTESSLLSCPYDWNTTSCSHANDAGVSCLLGSELDCSAYLTTHWLIHYSLGDCRSGSVRLIGGDNGYEGQVQFCLSGRWGTVSNDGWGTPEAQVVCKQLGHSEIGIKMILPTCVKALIGNFYSWCCHQWCYSWWEESANCHQ